jgi:hypothetical protein
MEIKDVRAAVIAEIQDLFPYLAGAYRIGQLGEELEKLSACFQALGICHLLESADIDKFTENLVRSGHARRYFLRKSQAEGNHDDRHLAISRSEAILDSLAAGHLQLAQEIVQLSRDSWMPSGEYEDDFCYYRFIHLIVLAPRPLLEQDLKNTVGQFEKSLEGAGSARLEICKAILTQSAEDFSAALEALLEQQQDENDQKRPTVLDSGFLFWPRTFVSVEGLALLRLADLVGLGIDGEFPRCPEIGRLANSDRVFTDLFRELENAVAGNP